MKFYYIVYTPVEEEVLKLNCPYIIEDYAKGLMHSYMSHNQRVLDLADGEYLVTLYRESNDKLIERGPTNSFIKIDNGLIWREILYGTSN